MHRLVRRLTLDGAALGAVALAAAGVLGEAASRTSLRDAQSARECRYPPLAAIVTEDHVRELEERGVVVIPDALSESTLRDAREGAEALRASMARPSNDEDVRQDRVLILREDDARDPGDALVHCIKLLRGVPFVLDGHGYAAGRARVVPRQCQLAAYGPGGPAYARHLDRCDASLGEMGLVGWLRASDHRRRVVTAILYLNAPALRGGELRVFSDAGGGGPPAEEYSDIVPSGGKLILFDSSRVEHQVLASRGDDRYALTCWFNGDLAREDDVAGKLGFLLHQHYA